MIENICEACGGDGIETCDNPDHGFIEAMPGDVGRLGCPCCGHDEDHKIKGSKCPECKGTGKIMENQVEVVKESPLVEILKTSGLEKTKADVMLQKFQDFFKLAADWERKAKTIVVTDETQTADMAMARVGRLELRSKRIELEKTRKELKEQSLREGKAIDGVARVLEALIVPIEEYLDKQEKFVEHKVAHDAELRRIEADKQAEEERLAKEKAEADERERVKAENERLKKEAEENEAARKKEQEEAANREKALADKFKAEQEEAARKQKEADDAARVEQDRIKKEADEREAALKREMEQKEAEAKAEQERIKKEAEDRLVEEKARADEEALRVKAEQEVQLAKERAEREAAERELQAKKDEEARLAKEEADRIEALKTASDKEKMAKLWLDLNAIEFPEVESEEAKISLRSVQQCIREAQGVIDVITK